MLRQSIIRQFKNFYLFNAEMFSFSLCGIKKNFKHFLGKFSYILSKWNED